MVIHYDRFETISNIHCSIYSVEGELIRKYRRNEINDESTTQENLYDDNRVKYIEVNAPTYPYYVVTEYTKEYNGLFHYPSFWPQDHYQQGLLQCDFSVEFPSSQGLRYVATFSDSLPSTSLHGKSNRYTWHFENLDPHQREIYAPPVDEIFPIIYLAPNEFKYDGHAGTMKSWDDFGAWLYSLLEDRSTLSPSKIAEVKELVANVPDTREKINIIYQHLQANTRYVSVQLGIGGYQPFSAQSVAENGYGDCKALTNYMRVMLDAVDIDSYYSVIGAGRTHSSFTLLDFPNSFQANHVILSVPLQSDTLWLECTSQNSPSGYLGSFTQGRKALMVAPTGGNLVATPSFEPEENVRRRFGELQISDQGMMEGVVISNFVGMQYESRRAQLHRSKPEQIKWMLQQSDLSAFSVSDLTYDLLDDAVPTVCEKLTMDVESYAKRSGTRLFIRPNILSVWSDVPPVNDARKWDIRLHASHHRVDTIIITLPTGYEVEAKPSNQDLDTPFGQYQTSTEVNGSELLYIRSLDLPKGNYSKTTYQEFRSFLYEVAKADKAQVVLVEQKT